MSVSATDPLMSPAPQVVGLPDNHLCIDLLPLCALITGDGGELCYEAGIEGGGETNQRYPQAAWGLPRTSLTPPED